MKILAIDTTAITAAAALVEDSKPVGWDVQNGTLTHSETMLNMIENLLQNSHTAIDDLDLLAVSAGPGSFTGVRIGVSIIKGLAFGKHIPCIPVSTLEALAENLAPHAALLSAASGTNGFAPFYACPVMDARRSQLYTAIFRYETDASGKIVCTRITKDDMLSAEALSAQLSRLDAPVYFVGEGCRITEKEISPYLPHCAEVPECIRYQSGYSVARVAKRIYEAAEDQTIFSDIALKPIYLRPSQAERERSAHTDHT